jgi:hypothetical protein
MLIMGLVISQVLPELTSLKSAALTPIFSGESKSMALMLVIKNPVRVIRSAMGWAR